MLKNIRCYFMRYKGLQSPLEKYFFPLVLLLYPLIGVNAGLDISDTMYNLANYQYIDHIYPMWMFSTYLSNVTGNIIMHLPFAGTMLGFSVYCSFLISLIALVVYYSLQDYMPGWMIFIGLFIAESLSWCPRVIMYNYLTYLFFTLGTIFLLKGMFAWDRQKLYLFLAGVCLGLNVMVRFPNVVEAGMILVLWFYCAITRVEFVEAAKKTGTCILGYLVGMGMPYIIISVIHGPTAYFDMIASLFGMTETALDYSSGGMLGLILSGYTSAASAMIVLIPCLMAGFVMFLLQEDRFVWIKKLLFCLGLLVLVRYYFAKGVFTRNYFYYDSIFKAAMMFVIIALILAIVGSTGFLNGSKQEQSLAFAVLMIVLITPLGSNNYTYPVINNLYIVAPITLWLMRRLMQRLGEREYNFAWQSMITMVIIVVIVQGILFHCNFAFVDGADGQKRDTVSTTIHKAKGMVSTKGNIETLEELAVVVEDAREIDNRVILFGGVPGLAYLFDLEPAIGTVWPDLDSYETERFDSALMELSVSENPTPMIIIGKDMQDYANIDAKYDILLDYIDNHDYNSVFESERFIVFAGNDRK
ncbi:MAG: hypothetical protein IJI01_10465 [Butyrivibrio sp.]|uniref:hypothetical protein n=1 Tax=Butyrivibrio sp. TaxID=28121 RepID=UPI0025BDBD92|nr:hypothetical protein [Butyrivibrio sp.]MBQ6589089.1 hypothetical protein [Butyrivibrio sp.]